MKEIFGTLTAGFSRFVLAWMIPSVVTLTIFVVFVLPEIAKNPIVAPLSAAAHKNGFEGVLVFAFAALLLSVVFAFTSLPLNRLLEGYTLPPGLRNRLLRRQIRRYRRLKIRAGRQSSRFGDLAGIDREQLYLYPGREDQILPTRLGNAYKAIEAYGSSQFGLDVQTFNYELMGVVPERLVRDIEDTRAQVDFFTGFVGQLGVLSVVSLIAGVGAGSAKAIAISALSAILARLAYMAALKNMTDVRYAMQALVHTGRPGLAQALGYRLPETLKRERQMWAAWTSFAASRTSKPLEAFDQERLISRLGRSLEDP